MSSSQTETNFSNNDSPNFQNVIRLIFNNWTALRLAVEHGMGGSPTLTQTKLENIVGSVMEILQGLSLESIQANTDWYKVSDMLEIKMDSEFSTILEDNSNDEVAVHIGYLYKFFCLGDFDSLNLSLNLLTRQSPIFVNISENGTTSKNQAGEKDIEKEAGFSTVDGWKVVKRR